jgi:hypothetical protein
MAQINKPNTQFNSVLYTGNGGTQSITGVNFQPDWVWLKNRNSTNEHCLTDVVRGATKYLHSNLAQAETTAANSLTSFDSDGFSLGNNANFNTNTNTYVAWNWLANGTAVSNTDGSITSSVSANTTAGFSIVSYTGNGTGGATIGHGLSSALSVVIIKRRNTTGEWVFGCSSLGFTKFMEMNSTGAVQTSSTRFNDTAPTSSVFSVGTAVDTNTNGGTYVAYCFADIKGFSKSGKYVANGSANGPFIYTGFKPALIITKPIGNISSFNISDIKRSTYNDGSLERIRANDSLAEDSPTNYDILSNGFKIRTTDNDYNPSGFATNEVIYMAFAENPLVGTNNIPATAR